MKENKVTNYSVRSARRRKAKNKDKAVKRTHAIRVACAIKPTDEMLAKRREDVAVYESSLYRRRQMSYNALNKIANDLSRRMHDAKMARVKRIFDASLVALSGYYAKKKEADARYEQKYMDNEYAYMSFPSN